MNVTETYIKGCYVIEPRIFNDDRGLFFESYNKRDLEKQIGEKIDFIQDNHSVSNKGVLRGLHFQEGLHAQTKVVRVIKGEALDVVVDLRRDSLTFGQYFKIKLSGENKKMLLVPKGMAHGFLSLEDGTIFAYKCDTYYNPEAEGGIVYNDSDLGIDWEYPADEIILSRKDQQLPRLKELRL